MIAKHTKDYKEIHNTLFDQPPESDSDLSPDKPATAIIKELDRAMKKAIKSLDFEIKLP